jgi:NAD+ synthase (glutamine-hydrolysing)
LDILETPITPELLPLDDNGQQNQETEEIIGPYELHDFFLYHMIRFGCGPAKIIFLAERAFEGLYAKEVLLEWLEVFVRRFFSQQFKRSSMPDGPKIGSVALSPRGDWRMPSDASSGIWLKEIEFLKNELN